MNFLPVLILIIAIASIFTNYKKAAEKRIEDEKKRRIMREASPKSPQDEPKRESVKAPAASAASFKTRPVQRAAAPGVHPHNARVSVKDMRKAVVMSEILSKPVSLREK